MLIWFIFVDPVLDSFLLVTDWTHKTIYQVTLESDEVRGLDIRITGSPAGIAYNPVKKTVIWGNSDTTVQNVHSVAINGSNTEIISDTGISQYVQLFVGLCFCSLTFTY